MVNEQQLRTYTAKERNLYLLGLAGQNIIYNIIGASLAYYLQFTLLIPAIAVSTIMALARVWDAFNDPMMGTIVDRTRTKWGKCRPYLIFVPLPIMIITILCFVNFGFYDPSLGMTAGKNILIVVWAGLMYVLWGMTYTVGDIPLWGVTALMTEKEDDRAKLLSAARVIAGIAGGVSLLLVQPLSLAIGEKITEATGWEARRGEMVGFILVAAVFAIIGCAMFQFTGLSVRERIPPSDEKHTLKENFKLMWQNKPFRQILISGVLGSPKMLLALCAMPLITYYYASKDGVKVMLYMVLLGGGMFIGQFLAMGSAPFLMKKWSKKTLYNFGNLICIVPFLLIFVMYKAAPTELVKPVYLIIACLLFFVCGGGMGLTTVLQSLMIADAVDYEEYKSGIRPDGVFFSGQTFIAKLTTGIATIISGIAYSVVGFSDAKVQLVNDFIEQGGIPREVPEFAPYLAVLFFLVSVPPAIGSLLSVIPTWHYCLDDKEHARIMAELNERRHGSDETVELPDEADAPARPEVLSASPEQEDEL